MITQRNDPTDPSSDILISRARHLDPDALAQIHDLYYKEIYAYTRFRLDDEMLVEDITAEVFLRLIDALKRKRGPHTNLRGWLYGTASNLVVDHFRRIYRRKEMDIDDHVYEIHSDTHLPEEELEKRKIQNDVRQALKKLTSEQQHVIALRFSSGYSLEQTAQLLEKNVNAVKALQFRALASLRRNLIEENRP